LSDRPLPLVSGSGALAFAAAFYSPDHPEYRHVWYPGDIWAPIPPPATLKRGWAAMCFSDEEDCIAWLGMAAPASRSVRSEFTVQSTLMGMAGATRKITALIVPPDIE
jgi:hypothetical protein